MAISKEVSFPFIPKLRTLSAAKVDPSTLDPTIFPPEIITLVEVINKYGEVLKRDDAGDRSLAWRFAELCGSELSENHLEVREAVRLFVQQNFVDIHFAEETPLQLAAAAGDLELVVHLVEKKQANVLAKYSHAFLYAAKNGHLEVVRYLKKFIPENSYFRRDLEDKTIYRAISMALDNRHFEIVRFLFTSLPQEEQITFAKNIVGHGCNGDIDTFRYFIEFIPIEERPHYVSEALIRFSKKYKLNFAIALIWNGADVHKDADKAFRNAVVNGDAKLVKFLKENGADIYIRNNYALRSSCANSELTPEHNEIFEYLKQFASKEAIQEALVYKRLYLEENFRLLSDKYTEDFLY